MCKSSGKLDAPTAYGQRNCCLRHRPCPFRTRPRHGRHDLPDRNRLPPLLDRLNDAAKSKVLTLQEYFVLAGKSLAFHLRPPVLRQDLVQQMDEIGVKSLGIVLLTGLFTGMVLALQSSVQLKTFGATMYIGNLVSASMIRELGPVLAGLMVAGRVGSGIAAQLGSMRVTEQIDALNTLGTDPIKKLVTPRVLAALIMLPVLTVINDFVGIIGGNVIAAFVRRPADASQYWRTVWEQIAVGRIHAPLHPERLRAGTVEAVRVRRNHLDHRVLLRARTRRAAPKASGSATTRTVVTSSILILIVDYFITQLLLSVLGG